VVLLVMVVVEPVEVVVVTTLVELAAGTIFE